MKAFWVLARPIGLICAGALGVSLGMWAQGPPGQGSETVARPKKKADATTDAPKDAPPATTADKIPSKFGKKADIPEGVPTFRTDALTVSVDVAVLDNKGHFIPKIPKGNFRILEDNVPQQVSGYSIGEAPMTITLVIEFSNRYQRFYSEPWFQTLNAAYGFLQTLKPEDYVAVVAYDLRPEILSDFSTNRQDAYEAMQRLRIAAFSESNLYDALVDTANRMQDIEGRKAILLISSGIDTFSKLTFDKTRRALQDAGVPIYAVGLMQAIREIMDAYMGSIQRMDFLQADNQMRTFAKESGGMAFFPRFYGEMPGIFGSIQEAMRNQYVLSYSPSNQERDGKFRKIKVDLVNPENNEPLRVVDEKGKPIKYQIVAKTGYTAPRKVE
ncbi:MAG TPA: VWA domain-containing protein [Bryobacteraceae bacterium]|nr:VWA domain-containing protein [Bryobacteraceae bacterium]